MTRSDEGFTLVEVMVATFIMGVLSIIGLVMLDDTLSSKETLDGVLSEVEKVEQARAIIKSDLAQIANRKTKDEFGFATAGVFVGGADLDSVQLMQFVRNGNEMPGLVMVSSLLQHIEYRFEHGNLIRRVRARVDAISDTPLIDRVLMSNLKSVQVEFFDGEIWADSWTGGSSLGNEIPAPQAVSLTLHTNRYGPLQLLFSTPVGY